MRFEASRVVFWSLSCYKELKLTTNRFTGRTLGGLLMQNISLRSSGMRRKQNFEFKSDTAVLTFTFAFSPPLFFCFSCLNFFFSCWAFRKLMMSQRVERTWIRMGGYGRFRGEWVKDFSDTKFVYQKIAELLVFVGTNTVTHLLKGFAFSRLVHQNQSY